MIEITLPDHSIKEFPAPITVQQLAASIGSGLAKAAIAGVVNGEVVDTSFLIEKNAVVKIITEKEEQALDIIRHSTAHLLAQAVKRLYPKAQVTIGPVIEDGFYYDFSIDHPFTPDELETIEKTMQAIVQEQLPVERKILTRQQAIDLFAEQGENYKVKIIQDIPAVDTLSAYQQGEFIDLCRGPHVPNTRFLKAFKLTKIAGAYWRGDAKNEMLQRIYGTAWANKQQLEEYLHRLEEAEKRDHRKIGKKMDLFHFQPEAPGMVFWHANGWTIVNVLQEYVRRIYQQGHYQEINTPLLVDRSLWEKSGHWEKFHEEMFVTHSENRDYAIKPMNCPCHVQVYNQGLKSYRDLPVRLAELGSCHRNETSGALHGLMRVRHMVQDDGHIFCTENQIQSEVGFFIQQLYTVYKDFGFEEIKVKLATRPEKRVGEDAVWDKAEQALANALQEYGIAWEESPGEGAFYGPKIEFSLKDCLGRVWQCGTMQLDFSMPKRLDAEFVDEDNTKKTPVMLHRAMLGSLERFIGVLLEHHAGVLPLWLAPIQVVVANISEAQALYAQKVTENLKKQGIRVILDLRNEKIGFKIREHTLTKVPYLVVIGDREVETNTMAVRSLSGHNETMTGDQFLALIGPDRVPLSLRGTGY